MATTIGSGSASKRNKSVKKIVFLVTKKKNCRIRGIIGLKNLVYNMFMRQFSADKILKI